MKLSFFLYSTPADNFHFWSAIACFSFFLLWVFLGKKLKDDNWFLGLCRLHMKFGCLYLLSSFAFVLTTGQINSFPLGSLLAGLFLYASFHYVYFIGIIFLVRKSLSIRLLKEIGEFVPKGECTEEKLFKKISAEKKITKDMSEQQLKRIVNFGLLKEKGSDYSLTEHGRGVNLFVNFFFKILQIPRN